LLLVGLEVKQAAFLTDKDDRQGVFDIILETTISGKNQAGSVSKL